MSDIPTLRRVLKEARTIAVVGPNAYAMSIPSKFIAPEMTCS